MKIEFATIQFTLEVKDGKLINLTPRFDVIQDNLAETIPTTPDGEYKWTLTMSIENAEKSNV